MPDEFDIQKLLRLKRHEQPPPEYFEEFLREFHQRQREELLRQPLWRLALDRVQAFVGELALPRLAYVGATTAVLVSAGIASYNILNPQVESMRVAGGNRSAKIAREVAYVPTNNPEQTPASFRNVQVWNNQPVQLIQAEMSTLHSAQGLQASSITPRYVIDTRPISYERPSSF